jgi:hypothetical protein
MSFRFRVALSYPGEKRSFVELVAGRLAAALGRDRVLYDKYHEAEFARPDLDTYLQGLYHDESELIVVLLCADYEKKEWCGIEWRAIRDLIKKRQTASVMPLRFDDIEIQGLFSIDGSLWIGERSPEEVAARILERLGWNEPWSQPVTGQKIGESHLPRTGSELFGREAELQMLDASWKNPGIRVLSLIAWGGVGKTSLVARWADRLGLRGYDGADYFEWSFYSQGTSDYNSASSDLFLDRALRHFSEETAADSSIPTWEKGERLAKLLADRRALLVLDGIEPMQYPPGQLAGELKDTP